MKIHSVKKIKCNGPCPYEPLTYPSGTLKDGTTYEFTLSDGGTVVDLGNGAIEFGSNDPTLTVTFSSAVDVQFTTAAAPSTRTVWHGNGTRYTRANTDGSPWCYTEGSVNANITVNGTEASTPTESGVSANADWGVLETFGASTVGIRAYVWDAYNFEARPLGDKVEQPICDVVETLCKKVAVGAGASGGGPETLTTLTANANNDALIYTDENGVANDIPLTHLQQEVCVGPFVDETGRSGWQRTGGPTYTTNSGTQTYMTYDRVGAGLIQAPDCITDMKLDIDFGMYYFIWRRFRLFSWIDYQVLVNGAVVSTRTLEQYIYKDTRTDTNPEVISPAQYWMEEGGYSTYVRNNIPAGATVEVRSQYRFQFNAAQTSASARIVGVGLRSNASAVFTPRNIVTGSL